MPESPPVNDRELRVTGMSRSGNHAVITWITRQAAGRVCYLNCAEPKTNPFETARPISGGDPYVVSDGTLDLDREARGEFSHKDWLIYNHEDCFLGMVSSGEFERRHDEWVGSSGWRRDLLILRDPFNLFASRMKSGYSGVTPKTAVRIWKQHAREFLGRRRYLPDDRIAVAYNRWVADEAYRRDLADRLGLEFTDAGIEKVARAGRGSSFDGLAYDGRATRMNVLRRWEHFADDPAYRELFDEQLVALSEAIFGPIPGTERLLDRLAASS